MDQQPQQQNPPQTPTVPPQLPIKPVKRNLWIMTTVIFALLFLFMTYQYASYRAGINVAKTLKDAYKETAQQTPTPISISTPSPYPMTNWKTYTNTKYYYSLRYPADWSVDGIDDVNTFASPFFTSPCQTTYEDCAMFSITTTDISPDGTIQPRFLIRTDNKKPDRVVSEKTIQFHGEPATELLYFQGDATGYSKNDGQLRYILIFNHKNTRFEVDYKEQNKTRVIAETKDWHLKNIFDQILSTFKFLSASPSPSCTPRPACLDKEPRCLIPETPDMCPRSY